MLNGELGMATERLRPNMERTTPDLLTSPCSFVTGCGPRFDVEAEAEVGFRQGHVQGVDLITQRHHGLRVARCADPDGCAAARGIG
jgi:hypothetical protein